MPYNFIVKPSMSAVEFNGQYESLAPTNLHANTGKFMHIDTNGNLEWTTEISTPAPLLTLTGQTGKILTNDGTNLMWLDDVWTGAINTLTTTTSTQGSAISTINSNYSTLNSTVSGVQSNITTLQGTQASQASTLSAHETSINTLNNNYTNLSSTVSTVQNSLSTVESTQSTQTTALNTLTTNYSALSSNVSTAQSNITTLQGTQSSQATSINTLNSNYSTLNSTVSGVQSNITALQGTQTSQGTSISTLNSNYSTLSSNVSTAQSNITTLQGTQASHDTSINTLNTEYSAIDTRVTNVESGQGTLQATQTSQASTLASQATTLTSYNGRISTLEGYPHMPTQTGYGGMYLSTDGSVVSWTSIPSGIQTVNYVSPQSGNVQLDTSVINDSTNKRYCTEVEKSQISQISGKVNTVNSISPSGGNVTLTAENVLPSQTGASGYYLTSNGTSSSWGAITQIPSQTGNSGKYLTTNGTTASWGSPSASVAYTMRNGQNTMSVLGCAAQSYGVSVTTDATPKSITQVTTNTRFLVQPFTMTPYHLWDMTPRVTVFQLESVGGTSNLGDFVFHYHQSISRYIEDGSTGSLDTTSNFDNNVHTGSKYGALLRFVWFSSNFVMSLISHGITFINNQSLSSQVSANGGATGSSMWSGSGQLWVNGDYILMFVQQFKLGFQLYDSSKVLRFHAVFDISSFCGGDGSANVSHYALGMLARYPLYPTITYNGPIGSGVKIDTYAGDAILSTFPNCPAGAVNTFNA